MADGSLPTRRAQRPRGPRVPQACTRCRTGKIRCDGKMPTCSPCADRGHSCAYPATQKVRGPGKSKQRIGELEERLAVLESMLRQQLTKDLSDDTASSSPRPLSGAPGSSSSPPQQTETPSGGGLMLPFHQITERFALWKRENCSQVLDRIPLSPVTASTLELRLTEDCLDKICAELPFLRIPCFLEQTRRPDALSVPDAWWQGIVNALIASTFSFQAINSSFRELAVYAWAFFRNAYAVLPELIIHGDSLGAAQAVIAMSMFMRNSADTRTTALLLSMATRMQHSAGLPVRATSDSITAAEDENRYRLYWAAFILDMDMAVCTGLPLVHDSQTVTMDLPSGDWLQAEGTARLRGVVFKLRAELARIQGRIATQLMAQLITPRNTDLVAVESEMEAWLVRVPFDIMPSWVVQPDSASRATDVPVAMLHLVYYNCQSMICWASVRHATKEMIESLQASADSIHQRTSNQKRMARAAARATIASLSQFPTQPFGQLWRALYYAVSASIALLALVCKEPTLPEAQGDLPLLAWFVSFLDKLVRDEGCDLERMRDGISKIERVATHAVTAGLGSAMPVNPALWPLSMASGRTGKAIAMLLTCESYHPMYIAQSFMGNTPNRDTQNAKQLAEILGLSWGKSGYGPFVPDSLMPATYGFAFGSSGSAE